MCGPNAASPANGAASKTDSPQNPKESASAEKPARFAFGQRNDGVFFVFQPDGGLPLLGLGSGGFDRAQDAAYCCSLLNSLDAERRGDNPSDVQRQLLEELRELVKLQRTSLTKMTSVVEDQLALQREAMGKSPQGEVKRPEPNVNDLMIEVARGFGLSEPASRSIGDLKGFCAAAFAMEHVPQAAKRPLLLLAARGALGLPDTAVQFAKTLIKELGLA